MKLRLTNTYEDTDGSCSIYLHRQLWWWFDWGHLTTIDVNLPMFTSWLHSVEFKEPGEVAEYLCDEYPY